MFGKINGLISLKCKMTFLNDNKFYQLLNVINYMTSFDLFSEWWQLDKYSVFSFVRDIWFNKNY